MYKLSHGHRRMDTKHGPPRGPGPCTTPMHAAPLIFEDKFLSEVKPNLRILKSMKLYRII